MEPRILLEDPELSYHAKERVTEEDIFDNRLIYGDNLLALKALEQEFAGKVKCIFIDPPYNTGTAFEHYDDGLEHSIWLSMMHMRLELLRKLLSENGSIWITIDDHEAHYLKVICDEVFGRTCFVGNAIWQHSIQAKGYSGKFSVHHNHLLVYSKKKDFQLNDLPRTEEHNVNYSNPDNDPRGPWRSSDVRNSLRRRNLMYNITSPSGKVIVHPPNGWRFSRETFDRELAEGKIKFSSDETRIIRKIYLADQKGRVPESIWFGKDVGTTRDANREVRTVLQSEFFETPKPEALLERVLHLATSESDLVLDSFAGSGTTGVVAHKMKRRWIMVELGNHCYTHIIPRLKKVVNGEDSGGISGKAGWRGGGGFRYYKLAPSLLKEDRYGQWIINEDYNAEMLTEGMCKHMGFTYSPSEELYWQHGHSTETDFIYVTTQTFNTDAMAHLSEEVGPERTLLVCCTAWTGNHNSFPNLTFTKIPNAVLNKCEFGKDDYSLNVQSLPMRAPKLESTPPSPRGRRTDTATPDMFVTAEEAES